MTDEQFIDEDGVRWEGTREELDAWKKYKQRKALAFVEHGYSVEWYADGDTWMDIYLPQRDHAGTPEVRASIKFFGKPSKYGIGGGMISKLSIQRRRADLLGKVVGNAWERVETLYNYDRGIDVDRLDEDPAAHALYNTILEELN
jgi:hypothetical protein